MAAPVVEAVGVENSLEKAGVLIAIDSHIVVADYKVVVQKTAVDMRADEQVLGHSYYNYY
jgi:hypothetical protein